MATATYLPMNEPATITIAVDATFMPSADKIKGILTQELSTAVYILMVDRSYFSERYVVTFKPRNSRTPDNWGQTFLAALEKNGYDGTVLAIEAGTESSMEGGLIGGTKNLLAEAAAPLQETSSTIKWAAAGVIALAAIVYLPALMSVGSGVKKGLGVK